MTEPWGRLLVSGGTDFATLGRKGSKAANEDRPDLPSPHIFRSVANVKFKKVFTSHSGCHAVALDIDSRAWLFGRNEHHQLSHPLPPAYTTPFLGTDGKPSDTPAANEPFLLNNLSDLCAPALLKEQGIVHAACGRNHTILVTDKGEAWSAGWNSLGQCGHANKDHVSEFTRVAFPVAEKVVSASCGLTFSLFLTDAGRVYSVGSGEKGQLGIGRTGEYIAASKVFYLEQSEPILVGGEIAGKNIVQISSGQQHSVCMDDEGFCFAWGFGGLGRLGLSAQFDCLSPTVIPVFAGPNVLTRCTAITAGSTNTSFIDGQGMYYLCGKWKTSGDGSAGQPWMFPKLVQEIQGYKWRIISSGGVTLFASTYEPRDGDFTVSWGQSANCGELSQGEGSLKSYTKPTRIDGMDGLTILDIAAGQNSTFFVARPPPLSSAPAPEHITVVPVSTVPVTTPVVAGSTGVDLSGFGFDFAPPPVVVAVTSKATLPVKASGPSRTETAVWEALLRFPEIEEPAEGVEVDENCCICHLEGDDALECEKCEKAFHGACLEPKVVGIPDGEWFCPGCEAEPPIPAYDESSKKRKTETTAVPKGKKKKHA